DQPIRRDLHFPGPIHMRPSRFGQRHFVMMLASDPKANLDAWAKLPPLKGANRFFGIKRGALTLAEDERERPLLVAQAYGAGRVMAFAADTTSRWWMEGFQPAHKRFWRQTVLWLARKDELQEGSVWIKLSQRRVEPGGRLEFTTGVRSATGDPITDARLEAEAVLPDGTTRPLRLSRHEDAWRGSFAETKTAGDYALRITAQKGDEPLGTARARFLVFEQDLELDNAAADRRGLESLAAMTEGQSIAGPEQLRSLLEELLERTDELEEKTETKHTLWDTWPFLLLLVGLLSVEWFLRKRWGLV
ncbi:MAG: hypothetical protein JW818_12000, partial [Pirellulales bacterium]|nr:hypothetical protein [Pirellulales bacterium]